MRRTGRPDPPSEAKQPGSGRLISLDAFRGFIMVMLTSQGFGLERLEQASGLGWLAHQFEHVAWEGMVFWDLIQPAFMFMVGLAMPLAIAARRKQGAGSKEIWRHVAYRAVMLVVISQVIMSIQANRPHFQLINVLSQIAFAYFLCYWIMKLPFRRQALAAALLLAGHWALFALFPGSEGAFSKADNVGAAIDHFLGLEYAGYYVTINFISSTVTMLFGVWAGYLMIEQHSHGYRLKVLAVAIAACFAAGFGLTLLNPMIKRLWTASFTLASAGWVLAMLLGFYWLVEVKGYRKAMFPLVAVGMNSIFIYVVSIVLTGWLDRAVGVFSGHYEFVGTLAPVAQATSVFLVMWYLCYWLYQRRIFIKI